ncbi:hypothetical protein [Chryseobacterium sp. IT-36CA2]|uniref:hypothetical protein n=1 Tax=Chryseobacterium sp. IT-36CA2 TaxID=3026460 RepID=UPI0039E0C909
MTKQRNVFQRFTTVCLTLIGLLTVLTSCNNDDEKFYDVTHKVVYKAEGSAGVNITSVKYNSSPPGVIIKSATNVSGTTWVSPELGGIERLPVGRVSSSRALAIVEATGANASSTLKVQIYVDGVLKKEEMATGQNLKVDLGYDVEYKVN